MAPSSPLLTGFVVEPIGNVAMPVSKYGGVKFLVTKSGPYTKTWLVKAERATDIS